MTRAHRGPTRRRVDELIARIDELDAPPPLAFTAPAVDVDALVTASLELGERHGYYHPPGQPPYPIPEPHTPSVFGLLVEAVTGLARLIRRDRP